MEIQIALGSLVTASPVIANGQPNSTVIQTNGLQLVAIEFPAAFTGASVTFLVASSLVGSYVPLTNTTSGTPLSYTVAQATYQAIDPKDFAGVQFLKIVSASNEGADRTLTVSLKGM